VVYEADLGKKTETVAKSMTEYNPGPAWHKTEIEQQETAGGPATK